MIELTDGNLSLGLVPDIGGSIAWLRIKGRDVMRPLSKADAATGNVLGTASFPMIPYANRIENNAFTFEGATYTVAANNGSEPFNVHGSAWKSVWTVEDVTASSAVLALDHDAGPDDPYSYRAVQHFSFENGALSLATKIENRGATRMPFGFGHHPWFPRDPDAQLTFRARDFWLEGPLGIVSDRIAVTPELDFAAGRGLPAGWRNNNYGFWDGTAELRFPGRGVGLVIEADPLFENLMFYADPKRDVFCLEPQTNVSCALNRSEADLGVIVLGPGERSAGTIRFTPRLL
mgnify:CR=1 FL=1